MINHYEIVKKYKSLNNFIVQSHNTGNKINILGTIERSFAQILVIQQRHLCIGKRLHPKNVTCCN